MTQSTPLRILLTLTFATCMACGEDDLNNLVPPPQEDMSMTRDISPPADLNAMDMATTDLAVSPDQDTTPEPFTGVVDPDCIDGQYTEALPVLTDISAQVTSYSAADARGFYEGILGTRYPMGAKLVSEAKTTQLDCVEAFKGRASTAAEALDRLGVVVHECGHFYDLDRRGFGDSHYAITPDLSFQCQGGGTTAQGGKTFARSRITKDMFASMRPSCQGSGCDFYANVYLNGDPDDAMFESGDQGYDTLLEEAVQYVNSLVTAYAFHDTYTSTQSDRDGILTLLWYLGRYLHMARTQYPDAYAHISQDACWRQATLTVWGRAWLFLEASRDTPKIGIDDEAIELLVMDPLILNEIELLRDIEGCSP